MAPVRPELLYLDDGPGEVRGVLAVDGRAHRLLVERAGEAAAQALGARSVARVARIERGLGLAFLHLPEGPDGLLPLGRADPLVEGASLEVEVTAERRADKPGSDKAAVLRLIGPATGPVRLLAPPPPLRARLEGFAGGVAVIEGAQARTACDLAQEEVLARDFALPGGGSISVEPTRALIAVDVDVGERGGGDARRAARAVNLAAIAEAARLIRLKGLGGLVVIDLVGKGHDGPALTAAARAAFAPEGAGVAIGPISRFGLFELAVPRTTTPLADRLTDASGRLSAETVALALLRALEREGRAAPGSRLLARCDPLVAHAALEHREALTARLGPRFRIEPDTSLDRRFEVSAP